MSSLIPAQIARPDIYPSPVLFSRNMQLNDIKNPRVEVNSRPPTNSEMSESESDSDINSDSEECSEDERSEVVVQTNLLSLPPVRQPSEGRFRLRAKRIMLTYPQHLHIANVITFLKNKIGNGVIAIRGVWETGSTGYQHTHMLINSAELMNVNSADYFDYNNQHPNIRVIRSILHLNNCIDYLDKQGKSEGDEISKEESVTNLASARNRELLRTEIQKCKTWKQVVNTQPVWGCMKWAEEVFNARKVNFSTSKDAVLKDWQKELINKIENPAHNEDRLVHWVWSREGNVGKTFLAKYLADHYDAVIFRNSGIKDIIYAYNYEPIVVFDLPRTDDSHIQYIYNLLEQFKDGFVFSAKYASVIKKMTPAPMVVVFANKPPMKEVDGRLTMSEDRWDIIQVGMRLDVSTRRNKSR